MTTIRVAGADAPRPQASDLGRALPTGSVQVKRSVLVEAARAGATPVILDHLQPDDILELEFQDGLRLWTRVDAVEGDLQRAIGRDVSTGIINLPSHLQIGPASRAVGGWAIKALKIVGIDIAGDIADFVSTHVEGTLRPGPGLYQCAADSPSALTPARKLGSKGPVLVLLHGTASSIDGSFSGLWQNGPNSAMRALLKFYEGRVVALQHRSLTESPIENAAFLAETLARLLGTEAELHLVSHSRGGLIGELLARSLRVGAAPITPDELALFDRQARQRDVTALKQLNRTLQEWRPRVTRFVRVACPARGTTLADRRLDRYFSVLVNAASLIPGLRDNPVYDALTTVLAGVLDKRTDPEELPGLEAMMPTSPVVRMLNRPDVRTQADLHVLGGDLAPSGIWGRLKTFATDLYYRDDHDLVVNTPAMLGGTERGSPIRYWIDTGGEVTHFHYFLRADTSRRLVAALTGSDSDYHTLTVAPSIVTSSDYEKRAIANQPVVVVLPGIMGSQLSVNNNPVWMDLVRLAAGGLTTLELTTPRNRNVTATGLLRDGYADICTWLAQTHTVVEFPYDWRLGINETAGLLQNMISEKLLPQAEAVNQPIRLLAHSMGGLVVRAMLATPEGQATWARMCKHQGARFIMLGTPNGGSHAMAAMLIGRDALVKKLALLDLRDDYQGLLGAIASFDGVFDLLPRSGSLDLFDRAIWERLLQQDAPDQRGLFGGGHVASDKAAGFRWVVPDKQALDQARQRARTVTNSPLDPARTVYVAGIADETACDLIIDDTAPQGHRVKVLASSQGDGRVLWETGIPKDIRTFYMDTVHGDLANDARHFPAIVDLLTTGNTAKLATKPPARRAAIDVFEMREALPDMVPDRSELVASALGGHRRREAARPVTRVHVRVVHDNVTNARHPVLVGHYQDDVIVAGEAYLDRRLQGRLSELLQMDLYPGPPGTGVAVVNETMTDNLSVHPGAVIAGLGMVGDLSPGRLEATLAQAMTLYGAECVGRERRRRQREQAPVDLPGTISAPITAMLVGSGEGGLSVSDCVHALVRAVATANERLKQPSRHTTEQSRPNGAADEGRPSGLVAQIDQLDIIELYEDRAIEIAHAVRRLGTSSEFEGFLFHELLVPGQEGQRRAWYAQDAAWWQRVRITSKKKTKALRFEALTQVARAAADLTWTERKLVEGFVDQAIQVTTANRDLGYTLFELLVPAEFKAYGPDRRKLALVLDEETAALPWELLQDRYDKGADPISVSTGMIRQLLEPPTRALRQTRKTALVIGNPHISDPRFPSLNGAAQEARVVATLLEGAGYEATPLLETDAEPNAVFIALHQKPWRILHLAGHGVFEFQDNGSDERVSGLALDNGQFFRAADARQLRYVPDLVFINCCFLGQTKGETRERPAYHKLAANLAVEFIKMGARAVIAAGWAVDDGAAKTFADSFYRAMLGGMLFGDAVRQARSDTYARHAGTNTWGAYQCYGDPSFSLLAGTPTTPSISPTAQAELLVWLEGVIGDARQEEAQLDRLRKDLDERTSQCPADWWTAADLLAAAGQAYAQVGLYARAIEYLERATKAERAVAPITAIEQLANCKTRLAGDLLLNGAASRASQGKSPKVLLEEAEELLHHLIDAIGETAERASLLGAVMKRRAMLPSNAAVDRHQALQDMSDSYGKALGCAKDLGDRANALANKIAADVILNWQAGHGRASKNGRRTRNGRAPGNGHKGRTPLHASLDLLKEISTELAGSRTDFFSLSAEADRLLLAALADRQLDKTHIDTIERSYGDAFSRGVAARQLDSVHAHFIFLRTLAEAEAPDVDRTAIVSALNRLEQITSRRQATCRS